MASLAESTPSSSGVLLASCSDPSCLSRGGSFSSSPLEPKQTMPEYHAGAGSEQGIGTGEIFKVDHYLPTPHYIHCNK